jgi:hypothetical protein
MALAERLFDGGDAETELIEALQTAGVPFERLGWDWYDISLELHGVPADYRLSEAAQRVVHEAGFAKVYVNHEDKWETHYSFHAGGPFEASKGWRVSYPHKRGESGPGIWVEADVPSWPREWFTSGYAVVRSSTTQESSK